MLQSMTAFAKAKKNYPDMIVSIEVHSVNKKYLDVQIKAAPEWSFFESEMKSLVSNFAERGQVTVVLQVIYTDSSSMTVHVNEAFVTALGTAFRKLATTLGATITQEDILQAVLREKGIYQTELVAQDSVKVQENIKETLQEALQEFVVMRKREGKLLTDEFQERLDILRELRESIQKSASTAPTRFHEKLTALLEQFVTAENDLKDRTAKEVALLADRVDVTEEISRLGFHLDHFQEMLQSQKPVGKVLEFILQEILREVNTIASKSQDTAVSRCTIFAKSEIEKMKEQVQNVQ